MKDIKQVLQCPRWQPTGRRSLCTHSPSMSSGREAADELCRSHTGDTFMGGTASPASKLSHHYSKVAKYSNSQGTWLCSDERRLGKCWPRMVTQHSATEWPTQRWLKWSVLCYILPRDDTNEKRINHYRDKPLVSRPCVPYGLQLTHPVCGDGDTPLRCQ
jgi:hypothetical protein